MRCALRATVARTRGLCQRLGIVDRFGVPSASDCHRPRSTRCSSPGYSASDAACSSCCRPEFCGEPLDQTSRDPKLVAHRNHKCFSHFRSIGERAHHRSRASASAQSSSEADCHERMATQSQQSLAHKSGTEVYDLSTVRQPEVRGEISPRIKCSSLRFKYRSTACMSSLKIGELATRTDCLVETMRYYERECLLAEPARTEANYSIQKLTSNVFNSSGTAVSLT
jgi:hypothetical protein